MAARSRLICVLFGFLGIFLCSCFVTNAISGKDESGSSDSSVTSADVYLSENGGYSFKPPEGYEVSEANGTTTLVSPGADPETGPMLALLGGLVDTAQDNDTLLEMMKSSMPEGEFSKAKKVKIDGMEGLQIDVEDTGDEDVVGQMAIVMVTPNQQFVSLAVSPKEDWKKVSKEFDKLLKSVEFFTPDHASADDSGYLPGATSAEPAEMLRQWAIEAVASTEYAEEDWSAQQAIGEPNVNGCGESEFGWASLYADTVEWIELTYAVPVVPYEITIVQNDNPSQVVDVTGIAEDGTEYFIWEGEPEIVDYCPDYLTISFEPYETFYINRLRITIDQSVLGIGWSEIDAVELVGMPKGASVEVFQPVTPAEPPAASGGGVDTGNIPAGKGFLATDAYLTYLSIPVNTVTDLKPIIGPLKSSTSQLKPRPDHKDTYMFDIGGDMTSYTRVTTSGLIYWKDIGQVMQVDMGIDFDSAAYETIKQMWKGLGYKLPYEQVAQLLGSPGMVIRHYLQDDGVININYVWFNSKGDRLAVFTYDGLITGSPSFIPKE